MIRYDPADPSTATGLLARADKAMYEQKRWKKTAR